jgi:hypothetical protein
MKSKRLKHVALALLAVTLSTVAYGRFRFQKMVAAQMPQLVEAPAGARAPRYDYLGVTIGTSSKEEVLHLAQAAGFVCEDRSMHTLVKDGVAKEAARKQAAGENNWAILAYGWLNPHGRNPQVRIDCQHEAQRLLFVFDDDAAPVRHVSKTTRFENVDDARPYYLQSANDMLAHFGDRSAKRNAAALEWLSPETTALSFGDLSVSVSATNYRERGVVLSEVAEVPWPIRGDAPARRAQLVTRE